MFKSAIIAKCKVFQGWIICHPITFPWCILPRPWNSSPNAMNHEQNSVPKVGFCLGIFLSDQPAATSQLKEPWRTKKFPRDNKAQPEGQNKSLYPPEGYKNYLVSEVWNNFKVLEAETSEKQFPAAEKKLELMKTAKTKSTKASIFVSSDPFSFSPSQSPEYITFSCPKAVKPSNHHIILETSAKEDNNKRGRKKLS